MLRHLPRDLSSSSIEDNLSVREWLQTLQGRLDLVLNLLSALHARSLPFDIALVERRDIEHFLRSTIAWVSEFRSKDDFKSKVAEVDDDTACTVKKHKG